MESTNQADSPGRLPEFPVALRTELVNVFKLLADDKRLLLLYHLFQAGELHVSALCKILDQTQPVVSHHLSMLREVGLLNVRSQGRHNYYSVCCDHMCDVVRNLFHFLCDENQQELQFHQFTMTLAPNLEESQTAQS